MNFPFLKRLMGFFSEPAATFRKVRDCPFSTALSHFIFVLVTFFIINLIVYQLPAHAFHLTPAGIRAGILITGSRVIFWIFLGMAVLTGLIIAGIKDGIQSVNVIAYAISPLAFFAFVPVAGSLWSLWGLGLIYLGLREFHRLSRGKALFAAIILPVCVTGILWLILVIFWPGGIFFFGDVMRFDRG